MAKPAFDPSKGFKVLDKSQEPEAQASAIKKPPFDPNAPVKVLSPQVEEKGIVQQAGEVTDKYTGAPTRTAIYAAQEGKDPLSAFKVSFGEDPTLAPTGQDIARKAGVSDETLISPEVYESMLQTDPEAAAKFAPYAQITKSGAAGLAIDIIADPTNILPIGTAVKLGGKGIAATAKGAGRLALKTTGVVSPGAEALTRGAAQAVAETAKGLKTAVTPKIAASWAKDAEIAAREGIDPELLSSEVKYGKGSTISKLEKAEMEKFSGDLAERHQQGRAQISEAIDRKLESFGGAKPLDPESAGEAIRDAYNSAIENKLSNIDTSYNKVVKSYPLAKLSPQTSKELLTNLGSVRADAQKMIEYAYTPGQKSQGEQVLGVLDRLEKKVSSGANLSDIRQELNFLGKAAYQRVRPVSAADIPPSQEMFQKMYNPLREAILKTTEETGGIEARKALEASNKELAKFLQANQDLSRTITRSDATGTAIFKDIVGSGNTKKLKSLREVIQDKNLLGQLGASHVESLKSYDKDGLYSFQRVGSKLRNDQKTKLILRDLVGEQGMRELDELVALGEKHGSPILNVSGTEISRALGDLPAEVGRSSVRRGFLEYLKGQAQGVGAPVSKAPSPFEAMVPSRPEVAARAIRVSSVEQQNEPLPRSFVVPPEYRQEAVYRAKSSKLSTVQKAKTITAINKGEPVNIDDIVMGLGVKDAYQKPAVVSPSSVKPQSSPSLGDVNNFIDQRRRYEY